MNDLYLVMTIAGIGILGLALYRILERRESLAFFNKVKVGDRVAAKWSLAMYDNDVERHFCVIEKCPESVTLKCTMHGDVMDFRSTELAGFWRI